MAKRKPTKHKNTSTTKRKPRKASKPRKPKAPPAPAVVELVAEPDGDESDPYALTPSQMRRLERRALREGWPIATRERMEQIVKTQMDIADGTTAKSNRESTSAFRALDAAWNRDATRVGVVINQAQATGPAAAPTDEALDEALEAGPKVKIYIPDNGR